MGSRPDGAQPGWSSFFSEKTFGNGATMVSVR